MQLYDLRPGWLYRLDCGILVLARISEPSNAVFHKPFQPSALVIIDCNEYDGRCGEVRKATHQELHGVDE